MDASFSLNLEIFSSVFEGREVVRKRIMNKFVLISSIQAPLDPEEKHKQPLPNRSILGNVFQGKSFNTYAFKRLFPGLFIASTLISTAIFRWVCRASHHFKSLFTH